MPIRLILFVFLIICFGCQKKKNDTLLGHWSSGSVIMSIRDDGTFTLSRGNMVTKGSYEVLQSNHSLVLTYIYGHAERRMISPFRVSEDGRSLAIDRSHFGTLVLKKQSSQRNTAMKDVEKTSANKGVSRKTNWSAGSMNDSIKKDPFSPREKQIIAKKLDRGSAIQSFTPAIEKAFPKENRNLAVAATNAKRFNFPTTAKSRMVQQPAPMIWAKFGLRKWIKQAPKDYEFERQTFKPFNSTNSLYREEHFAYSPSTT